MWTASNQKKGYMAVTAHYIDGSWTLQSRILRFIYVPAPHTSERLDDYQRIKLRETQPTTPSSSGATNVTNDEAEFDAYVEAIAVSSCSSAKSWLWAAENNGARVAEDFATVLNEMDSDDEAELVESSSGYHFED
ncbi:hypothetical protein P8452_71400 [Trifolium repens]|nr:hypothetical protein P8452_71400 [Trifolium repens]